MATAVAPVFEPEVVINRSVLPLFTGAGLEYVIHRHQTNSMTMIRILYTGNDENGDRVPLAFAAHKCHDQDIRTEVLTNVSKLISELEAFRKTAELFNEE